METSGYQEFLLVFNLGASRAPSSVHHKQLWSFRKYISLNDVIGLKLRVRNDWWVWGGKNTRIKDEKWPALDLQAIRQGVRAGLKPARYPYSFGE